MLVSAWGECILLDTLKDPRVRYDVPGATGRDVVVLDLYPGTGGVHFLKEGRES